MDLAGQSVYMRNDKNLPKEMDLRGKHTPSTSKKGSSVSTPDESGVFNRLPRQLGEGLSSDQSTPLHLSKTVFLTVPTYQKHNNKKGRI